MSQHPARTMDFGRLIGGLEAAVAQKHVSKTVCPETGLCLYVYSQSCVYDRAWNEYTLLARGLIVDPMAARVVATPFPKFFNVSERGGTIPALEFETFEKLDGSLIILFWHAGAWRTATKGSFISSQAKWARDHISRSDLSGLDKSVTYLAEAIYPANRIVVQYGVEGLFLLAGYRDDGHELAYRDLERDAKAVGWPLVKRHAVQSVADLLARAENLPLTEEGWVIRFSNGLRLKIKGEEYLRIHRLVSRLTPLSVWEAMWHGDDLVAFRRDLPEEFWADFDTLTRLIQERVDAIVGEAASEAAKVADLSDKEVGLRLMEFPAAVRSFIFPFRKSGGNILAGRARDTLFRAIRPTANHLPGYMPSSSVARVIEEEG